MFEIFGWLAGAGVKGFGADGLNVGMLRLKLNDGAGGWTGWD
jgi:hypothetical protein